MLKPGFQRVIVGGGLRAKPCLHVLLPRDVAAPGQQEALGLTLFNFQMFFAFQKQFASVFRSWEHSWRQLLVNLPTLFAWTYALSYVIWPLEDNWANARKPTYIPMNQMKHNTARLPPKGRA